MALLKNILILPQCFKPSLGIVYHILYCQFFKGTCNTLSVHETVEILLIYWQFVSVKWCVTCSCITLAVMAIYL